MLQGLLEVEGGGSVLPFVRQFYGPHQLIGGTMTRESHTKSCKGRAGSKGPFDASFVRTGATRSFGGTSCVVPLVLPTSILLSSRPCGSTQGFKFITARPSSGIGAARLPEGGVQSQMQLGRSTWTQSCGAEILNSLLPSKG